MNIMSNLSQWWPHYKADTFETIFPETYYFLVDENSCSLQD